MKVFLAGGGTGGHFYPALSVADKLKEKGFEIFYFGTEKGIEAKKDFPADKKFLYPITGVRGKDLISSVRASVGLIKTSLKIAKLIKDEKPDFSLCFGGYTSLPLGIASFLTGTPLFLHEQNSIPSYTNRVLSKFARKIFITFEHSRQFFPEEKTVLTGMPVRKIILDDLSLSQQKARELLGLKDQKTVLVFGGSQGARKLSEVGIRLAERLLDVQFIIIGGKHFKKPDRLPENVIFFDYYDRMGILYAASDIVISRSGAASTYEILSAGKFGIFIPYPYAASNHQYYNVRWLEEKAVCKIIREEKLDINELEDIILSDINIDTENIKKLVNKDATGIIVDRILDEIHKK
ncbi:UDP-N-acetylglucosamine-N-acetylmuramylpentapeptide N-acetylglucosamine transferase [Persephonella hydrogeniphila]|uniref:UDP-N-acetylglucosamine--N-acetylmuramyl-(pentapeptide) pyrophosphoryl-undecaprenol N-acetylglucosamine transferase n=1 Tax=Persephonella hydrogeniphila TaxID=198703 RepID=A0A285N2V1_9AQUI|nr:UDP-N-acetylglucosamine--N-acetylmuramyl-(pentapeptide) pyrophosphoryl-undecaprenol N-acetylglucosamine transferase [Persephonella hydrogeniphila]SNZ02346.1 UDP-N-acetylglucosamine-N-acetylmuramylpentapeptide N-acetylglucosamine transferase [Persephonella hydrogeniphila]